MKAIRYHEHGDTSVLQVDEIPVPEPTHEEVRIAVNAAGVNPIDTHLRTGSIAHNTFPMIPGSDFAGVIDAVGDDIDCVSVGDRVFGTGLDTNPHGTYSEYVVAPKDKVAPLPEGPSFSEGAALAHVGVTAWRALFHHATLTPGDTCLVHGGSGGVGHLAVQLAARTTARVLATVGSEPAGERVRELGADETFDYRSESLQADVESATDGGVDTVLDHIVDRYLQFDTAVTAFDADVVCLGGDSGTVADAQTARNKDLSFHFVSMYNTPNMRPILEKLGRLLADGQLTVDIAQKYELAKAEKAQRAVVEESFIGKLVLDL